jgi:hypothetical protein
MSQKFLRSATPLLVASMYSATASATSGAHPPAVSTFDTRASSVALAVRNGFADTTWRAFSYNANFSSTGGNLSAQFGLHYMQIREKGDDDLMHGAAVTGAGVLSVPLAKRFDNGVPFTALNIYAGAAPTLAGSGASNFISLPLTIGVGVTISPLPWLSFTPWFEAAPSGTLDTRIRKPDLTSLAGVDTGAIDFTQLTPEQVEELQSGRQALFTQEDIDKVIDDSIDLEFSIQVPLRAGLMTTVRLGERFSLNVDAGVVGFGPAFSGPIIGYAGGAIVFHWDDIVPAVLPAQRRLQGEQCEDVEARFKTCPAGKKLFSQAPAAGVTSKLGTENSSLVAPALPAPAAAAPTGGASIGVKPAVPPAQTPPSVVPSAPALPSGPPPQSAPPPAGGGPAPAPGDVAPSGAAPAAPAPAPAASPGLPTRTSPYEAKPPSARFEN